MLNRAHNSRQIHQTESGAKYASFDELYKISEPSEYQTVVTTSTYFWHTPAVELLLYYNCRSIAMQLQFSYKTTTIQLQYNYHSVAV